MFSSSRCRVSRCFYCRIIRSGCWHLHGARSQLRQARRAGRLLCGDRAAHPTQSDPFLGGRDRDTSTSMGDRVIPYIGLEVDHTLAELEGWASRAHVVCGRDSHAVCTASRFGTLCSGCTIPAVREVLLVRMNNKWARAKGTE
jgi:hypothetical protein